MRQRSSFNPMGTYRGLGAAYSILNVYGQFPTLGLRDNIVYDIIPITPNAAGATIVNASIYNVTCAAAQVARPIEVRSQYAVGMT